MVPSDETVSSDETHVPDLPRHVERFETPLLATGYGLDSAATLFRKFDGSRVQTAAGHGQASHRRNRSKRDSASWLRAFSSPGTVKDFLEESPRRNSAEKANAGLPTCCRNQLLGFPNCASISMRSCRTRATKHRSSACIRKAITCRPCRSLNMSSCREAKGEKMQFRPRRHSSPA